MIAGTLLFIVCALMCLAGAVITIIARNPIRGAMGLLTTIVGIAGLFLRLNAQFLAAMQILVYAGAVVILFVFVIMLLGPSAGLGSTQEPSSRLPRYAAGGLFGVMGIGAIVLLGGGTFHGFTIVGPEHGSVEMVGARIFAGNLVPFELATALLIVAVVGALAIARSKPGTKKKVEVQNPTLRMFHGPLMARDAERPLPSQPLVERAPKESV